MSALHRPSHLTPVLRIAGFQLKNYKLTTLCSEVSTFLKQLTLIPTQHHGHVMPHPLETGSPLLLPCKIPLHGIGWRHLSFR